MNHPVGVLSYQGQGTLTLYRKKHKTSLSVLAASNSNEGIWNVLT